MIDKREIIDIAATLSLTPQVVEKDYVLGWLLWGINNKEELSANCLETTMRGLPALIY